MANEWALFGDASGKTLAGPTMGKRKKVTFEEPPRPRKKAKVVEKKREVIEPNYIQPQEDEFPSSDSQVSIDEEEQKARAEQQMGLLMSFSGIFRDTPVL